MSGNDERDETNAEGHSMYPCQVLLDNDQSGCESHSGLERILRMMDLGPISRIYVTQIFLNFNGVAHSAKENVQIEYVMENEETLELSDGVTDSVIHRMYSNASKLVRLSIPSGCIESHEEFIGRGVKVVIRFRRSRNTVKSLWVQSRWRGLQRIVHDGV